MIELRNVINIHNILIDKFGGSKGIRDKGSLESASALEKCGLMTLGIGFKHD